MYCQHALGIFAAISSPVDHNLVWLVAGHVPLCDTVDTRFGSRAWWEWQCGIGLGRGHGRLGGCCVICGTQILESEERGEDRPAVCNVEPVSFHRLRIARHRESWKDIPIEIVMLDLNGLGPCSNGCDATTLVADAQGECRACWCLVGVAGAQWCEHGREQERALVGGCDGATAVATAVVLPVVVMTMAQM
jgi:hypothetical protein